MAKSSEPAARSRNLGAKNAQPVRSSSSLALPVVLGLSAILFTTRFFLPAESAAQGETLWIAGLWIVCGIVWGIGIALGQFPRIRPAWQDAAVAVWIGCQVLSAIAVILTGGDKRSAANMAWEWVGLSVVWLLARHAFFSQSTRQAILRSLLAMGTVLAGYGLYQHYVSHPRLAAEYAPLFDALKTATGPEAESIRNRLARDGVPTEGPAVILYEKRLRDSREPLGMFALANSFGGLLSVCLILAIGEVVARRLSGTDWRFLRRDLIPLLIAIGLIGWCLLLTKSRTAWIGTMCGLALLAVSQLRLGENLRRYLGYGAIVAAGIAVVVAGLFALGGLDEQVLSEAPKSLSYRLQYWRATSRLIANHPWLGVGPGNFRQHYLQYKLPEASEEIADPHNEFFEMAATGGILSAVGLALFLAMSLPMRRLISTVSPESKGTLPAVSMDDPEQERLTYWLSGAGSAFAFLGLLFYWGEWNDTILMLGVFWFLAAALLGYRRRQEDAPPEIRVAVESWVATAAAIALAVHLLGAGGIAMPAITQILIVLVAWGIAAPRRGIAPDRTTAWQGWSVAVLLVGLMVGFLATGLLPVKAVRGFQLQGRFASREAAIRATRQTALADPWSAEPWRNQFERLVAGGIHSNESFESAVESLQEAMRRDPANFWTPRTLGTLWTQKWQVSRNTDDAEQAVRWLRQAHQLHPTNSGIQAELAFALEQSQDRTGAQIEARGALAQDEIYRRHGHIDRYLDDSTRQRLRTLSGDAPDRAGIP